MEPSTKRRRITFTRNLDISPVKILPDRYSSSDQIAARKKKAAAPASKATSLARLSPLHATLLGIHAETLRPARRDVVMDGPNDESVFDSAMIGSERRRKALQPPSRFGSREGSKEPLLAGQTGARLRKSASSASSLRDGSTETADTSKEGAGASTVSSAAGDRESLQIDTTAASTEKNGRNTADTESPDISDTGQLHEPDRTVDDEDGTTEPDLPTLPAQLGLEDRPAAPQGMLSSSPSGKRLKRLNRQKSSLSVAQAALKPGASEDPDGLCEGVEAQNKQQQEQEQEPAEQAEQDEESLEPTISLPQNPAGPIITWDVEVEKKQNDYETLLSERAKLEAEIRLLEQGVLSTDSAYAWKASVDDGQLLQVLLSAAERTEQLEERVQPTSSSTHEQLVSFLPFTLHSSTKPQDLAPSQTSHPPPLPTPFEQSSPFSSLQIIHKSLVVFTQSLSHDPTLLEHRRVFKLASADGLLDADVELTSYPTGAKRPALRLLSISEWANEELHVHFTREFLGISNPTLITNGISHYWELACIRAETWAHVVSDHPGFFRNGSKSSEERVDRLESIKVHDASYLPAERIKPVDEAHARRYVHIGRQQLRLQQDDVALIFEWRIKLDADGEARSELDACVGCPQSWRESDRGRSLDSVGAVFHLLVRRQGVREAVRAIVALVIGPERASDGGLEKENSNNESTTPPQNELEEDEDEEEVSMDEGYSSEEISEEE